jgi:hypothetical protein
LLVLYFTENTAKYGQLWLIDPIKDDIILTIRDGFFTQIKLRPKRYDGKEEPGADTASFILWIGLGKAF